jgi:hypothetical protein
MGGTFRPIVVGAVAGTLGALAYAALCAAISWAILSAIAWMTPESLERALGLAVRFGLAGAVAGATVGTVIAIDRFVNRKTHSGPVVGRPHRVRLSTPAACRNGTPSRN